MKLLTALSTAAILLAPAVALSDAKMGGAKPYPDWDSIAKTAQPSPQKEAEQPAAKPSEPGLLEKAGQALEAITGRSGTMKETPSQEGASQMKPSPAAGGTYPYPDWSAIAKTGPATQEGKE